jgi:predicted small lipoprotein YifL
MYGVLQILVSTAARRRLAAIPVLALLAACGQKGPLVLPSGEAAAGRVTLPQALQLAPSTAVVPAAAASTPPTGTAAPVRNP